jgi:hypothetical protein
MPPTISVPRSANDFGSVKKMVHRMHPTAGLAPNPDMPSGSPGFSRWDAVVQVEHVSVGTRCCASASHPDEGSKTVH